MSGVFKTFVFVSMLSLANISQVHASVPASYLNELISLLRRHTGVMEGPVSYSFMTPDGHRTRVTYGMNTEKVRHIRLEVVELIGRVTKASNGVTRRFVPYEAVYEDDGPDGMLDRVKVKYFSKSDEKEFGKRVSTKLEDNQSAFDLLVFHLIEHLQKNPAI